MQRRRSPWTCSYPSLASVPGSADRKLRKAEVISLDAAHTVSRPQVPKRRMTQPEIMQEPRKSASQEFFLQDEPLFRFRDFRVGL